MKLTTAAMVVGIIGGVYGLIAGFIGGAISASVTGRGLVWLLALAAPIIGVVGAGIVKKKPLIGSALMAVGAVGMIFANFFGIVPAALFLVGAILGAIGKFQS
jgi:hypothetical protein